MFPSHDRDGSSTVSNVLGYQSYPDVHKDHEFEGIRKHLWKKTIKPGCDVISERFYQNGFTTASFSLINIWFNVNGKNAWNKPHTHPHSFLSGVLWIKVPEDSGELVFHSPNTHNIFGMDYTIWSVPPEEGKIILFPSYLEHSVNSNNSNEERISLSFNIALHL